MHHRSEYEERAKPFHTERASRPGEKHGCHEHDPCSVAAQEHFYPVRRLHSSSCAEAHIRSSI